MPILLLLLLLALPLSGQSGGPPTPTGLTASDGAYATKVGLAWDHVRNGKIYEIWRSESDDPTTAEIVGATESIIFFDLSAQPGQSYFYWVRALDGRFASPLSEPDAGFRANGREREFGPIGPLEPPRAPEENPVTGAKIYLGKTLFWDEQLSSTRTVACGTCHRPASGGADPRSAQSDPARHPGPDDVFGNDDDIVGSLGVPAHRSDGLYERSPSFGLQPQVTHRKAQSVFEAAYADVGLLWDGKAGRRFEDPLTGETLIPNGAALESQALLPLQNTTEMAYPGRTWGDVLARVAESRPLALSPSIPPPLGAWIGDRTYPELFAEAFGTAEATLPRMAMAIASYERTLYSDRTPLDLILAEIIEEPASEARGRELFFDLDCAECHRTSVLTDNRFRFIGVRPPGEDRGRSEISGSGLDIGKFRIPGLRNVALRAPYMHNGRFASLEEVIEFYDRGGDFDAFNKDTNFIRRLNLSGQEKADLLAFLRNELTDPRVAAEAGPLFDRPLLYSESARPPEIIGPGTPGPGGVEPQAIVIEPPLLGNPSFTAGLSKAAGGAEAVLVIDENEPETNIPATASFARVAVLTAGEGPGEGYASVSLSIPNNPALAGSTLFGRWFVRSGGVSASPLFRMTLFGTSPPPMAEGPFASVSAASLQQGFVAPESIASGFGDALATSAATAAMLPLPETLGGVRVAIRDAAGFERLAPLFFVSPAQINYLVPAGTAPGEARATVLVSESPLASGTIQVARTAPSLFTANADGRGVAAALAVRVRPDGSQLQLPVAVRDEAQDRFVPAAIELGPEDDQVFLMLFGTGFRFADSAAVTVTVGGEPAEVRFAGAQPEFAGVDQLNLLLPRSLAGRGDVEAVSTADGKTSNRTLIRVR